MTTSDSGPGLWIAIGMGANAVLGLVFTYLRSRPFVPSYNLTELRDTVKELRDKIEDLETENKDLRNNIRALERSRAFWQQECEDLKEGRKGDC